MDELIIQLQNQFWMDENPENSTDFCSHGQIIFKINDVTFLDGVEDARTAASTALRLMKSALKDYDANTDLQLIPCCGYLLGPGCPTFLTYSTKVTENTIIITKVINSYNSRLKGTSVTEGPFTINKSDYIKQILIFARKVKAFYASCKPRDFSDKINKVEYDQYWREFESCYLRLKDSMF